MFDKNEDLILDDKVEESAEVAPEAPEVDESPEVEEVEAPKEKKAKKVKRAPKKKFDAINVFNGKVFVRQYSLDVHGKDFARLAEQFSTSRGYGVEAIVTEELVKCPGCGHKFSA